MTLKLFTYFNQELTTWKHVILYGNNLITSHDGHHQRSIKVVGVSQVKYLQLKSNFKKQLNYQPEIATSRMSTKQNIPNIHHQHALTGVAY